MPPLLRVRSALACSTFKVIEFFEEAHELKGREEHESTAMLLGQAGYGAFSKAWPDVTEVADGEDSVHPAGAQGWRGLRRHGLINEYRGAP